MKPTEGRSKTLVNLPSLEICVGGKVVVAYNQNFFVDVTYFYEKVIKATEDEPACPEYVEALSIRLLSTLYIGNSLGMTIIMDSSCELLDVLSFAQTEAIETSITAGDKESFVPYPEPIRAKMCTTDNLRLP